MRDLDSIWLEGNLIGEPEKLEVENGRQLLRFKVATTKFLREIHEVSVFDVEVWEPQKKGLPENLGQGRGVRISGRLHRNPWNDRGGEYHREEKIVSEIVEVRPHFRISQQMTVDPR